MIKSKKSSITIDKTKPFKTDIHGKVYQYGQVVNCSVCGKEFPIDEETNYYCNGGFPCSWECFLKNIKNNQKLEKSDENIVLNNTSEEPKKKRGRPKKNV